MIIRILWVVAALTVAFVLSYKLDLSKWWTLFFTMIVGSAVSFLAIYTPYNLSDYVTDIKSYQTKVESKYIVEHTNPPVMLATIVPMAVPAQTGRYQPECYVSVYNGDATPLVFNVSDTDYGTLLEGNDVTVSYYYIGDTIYNVKLGSYDCQNRINIRDADIFTQTRLLKEALQYADSH